MYSPQQPVLVDERRLRSDVPTDDEEEEASEIQQGSAPLSPRVVPRRVILLKRPELPRGHSPAKREEDANTSSSSSPTSGSNTCEQPEEASPADAKPTAEAANPSALTLEEREVAYEEARRRIFGSPSISALESKDVETRPIPPPIHGQPRPLRPRPFRQLPPSYAPYIPDIRGYPAPPCYPMMADCQPVAGHFDKELTAELYPHIQEFPSDHMICSNTYFGPPGSVPLEPTLHVRGSFPPLWHPPFEQPEWQLSATRPPLHWTQPTTPRLCLRAEVPADIPPPPPPQLFQPRLECREDVSDVPDSDKPDVQFDKESRSNPRPTYIPVRTYESDFPPLG